jgi:DNA replication and repair protein RecF
VGLMSLEVRGFRNLPDQRIPVSDKVIGVVGGNGAGKSSLLEAIYCLSTGRSSRSNQALAMIQHGAASSLVRAQLSTGEWVAVQRFRDQVMKAKINQTPVLQTSSLAETLPVEIMDPTTIELLLGEPERRRRLMNWGLFHVKPEFRLAWTQTLRALQQRNANLRKNEGRNASREWLALYARYGEQVHELRKGHIQNLSDAFSRWLDLFGWREDITLDYRKGWASQQTLHEALVESESSDQERGFTQRGVHRADLILRCRELPLAQVCSRGEIKVLAWILKLAQLSLLPSTVSSRLVLLLDDFGAELDLDKGRKMARALSALPHQIFVTGTSLEVLQAHWGQELGRVFHVKPGIISAIEGGPYE